MASATNILEGTHNSAFYYTGCRLEKETLDCPEKYRDCRSTYHEAGGCILLRARVYETKLPPI